ncbi:MAG: ORF6N domain-containing protein [Fibrobacteraceae bacterium]
MTAIGRERYGAETKSLNQAVTRNSERFPERNYFQLSKEEYEILRSQFVTSSWGRVRKVALFVGGSKMMKSFMEGK